MMKKRNGSLCFWAFIFCMIFVLHYAYFFDPEKAASGTFFFFRGELAIDFFFLFTGVLFAQRIGAIPEDRGFSWRGYGSFLKSNLRFYLPAFAICWVATFVVINKVLFTDVKTLFNNFLTALLELLPFRSAGFYAPPADKLTLVGYRVMDQAWVISAVFIGLALLYPLYLKNRRRFEYYIAPVGAVLLLCFLYFRTKVLSGDNGLILDAKVRYLFYSFIGTYKAVGEILAGVTCCTIARHFSNKPVSKAKSHLLSVVEIAGYLAVIFYMQFILRYEIPKMFDFLAVGVMLLSVMISVSGKSSVGRLFNHKFFYSLGKFSLYPFLMFMLFAKSLRFFFPEMADRKLMLVYLALTLASAVVVMLLEKPFVKLFKSMKKLFIKTQPQSQKKTA